MKYSSEIELLSKIRLKDLPKPAYSRDPKEVVKEAIRILRIINESDSIEQEILNKLIQVHQDSDVLTEHSSGVGKIEITKVYKSTLKVLRDNILHSSNEVDEAIKKLENTFDHEKSSFRITGYEDKEIKGNVDGLREFAVQLLKVSNGKMSELNEDWFGDDRDNFPTIITLNYYDKTKDFDNYADTWKEKFFKLGCGIVGIFCVASFFIGLIWIIKWIIKMAG